MPTVEARTDGSSEARRPLSQAAGLAELVVLRAERGQCTPPAYAPNLQIAYPLGTAFQCLSDRGDTVCDPNHIVTIQPGIVSRDRPLTADYARFLILTLTPESLDRLGVARPAALQHVPPTRAASPQAQRLAAIAAAANPRPGVSSLFLDEALVRLAHDGLEPAMTDPVAPRATGRRRRLVERAKEVLAAASSPLSLTEIAAQAGASPAYLTDLFRQLEGMPIARYQMRLRLARALTALRDADDITALALDLGFSSHSHFSSCFSATFGVSPSEHRMGSLRGLRLAPMPVVRPPARTSAA